MSKTLLSNKLLQFLSLIRFFSPTGYILLFLPCVIGTGLYSDIYHHYPLILLFFIGSVVMRSAGCIVNDIFDRNIDKYVKRTKSRPIAAGNITVMTAIMLFAFLCLIGLIILLQLSIQAIILGFLSLFLVITYPLMKRITFWPQLFLGITYNIGVLISVAHIKHTITAPAIITYIGCIFWTLYYDTIYGFMDIEDDKKIGVKSLARYLETKNYRLWLSGFAITALFLITSGLILTNHNFLIILIATIPSCMLIMWQITTLKINLPSNCLIRFKSNNYLGIILALTAVI